MICLIYNKVSIKANYTPQEHVLVQQNQLVYFEDKFTQYVILDVFQEEHESYFKAKILLNGKLNHV